MHAQIKILIVDDHPIFRKGLSHLINDEGDMHVCGEAEDITEARNALKSLNPDLVLLDISLKNANGLELIEYIIAEHRKIPVLVLSMHDESIYAERVLKAGGMGYIMKQEMTGKVVDAIRKVRAGHIYVSEKIASELMGRFRLGKRDGIPDDPVKTLSNREFEIFRMTGEGLSPREMARRLNLSVKTIGSCRENIKKKLNVKSMELLIKYAIEWQQHNR